MINITLPNTSGYFDVDRETVSLKRGSTTSTLEQLGFCLVGSRTRGVFIKSIYPGSPVEQSGRIHVDDKLVQADDVPLLGLTPSQVVRILNSALSHSPTIQLTILHCCHPSSRLVPATVNENPSEQHGEKVVERNSTTIDTSNGNGDAKTKSKSGSISAEAEVHISETKEDDKKGDTLDVISTKTNAEVIDEDTAKCKNNDKSPQESVPTFKGRRVTFANMSMENSSDSTGDLCSICENDLVSPPENRSQKARLDRFSANYEKLAISRSQRRIFCRDNIDKIPNDELPLISFDQLVNSNQSISPVDNKYCCIPSY
ncbi:unnamed protein product [Soboliphyme baturini]|uniref:PDZ domain-containing protein n=1 Tax=Soboliphyme baturini TaxID=241478 RepID=A0A183J4R3_9BILA|nr:unnamed protein product [Soboliphyme baturini]